MTIQIKIVGVDSIKHTVLVKGSSENSQKPIDEYDAISFEVDYTKTKEEFVNFIMPTIQSIVEERDLAEQTKSNLGIVELVSWNNFSVTKPSLATPEDKVIIYTNTINALKDSFPVISKNYVQEILAKEFVGQALIPYYNIRGLIGVFIDQTGYRPAQETADIQSLRGFDAALEYLFSIGVPIFGEPKNYYAPIAVIHTNRVYGFDAAGTIEGPEKTFIYFKPTFELSKKFKHYQLTQDLVTIDASGFTYKGKLFQSDTLSREKINTINMTVMMLGQLLPSIVEWKAADNTTITFADVADWIGFFTAMVNRGAENYLTIANKKQALAATTSQAQVDLIEIIG